MSLFVWGHWHFPSLTLMGNHPTFVCQQSAQKTFLRMLFYVLLLICLCCILACCLFCSADGIQLREKNKTCVMPSQHPIRHAADNFPCPTFSSSGPCWVLTKRIQWPPYPLDQKRQVLALPPFTRQHIFIWSVGQNSIFYFVWKMSLYASCEFIICILLTFPLFSGKRRRWWTFLPASWSAWRAEEGRCVKPLNCDFSLFLSHFFVCCVNVWCCVF